MGIFSGSRAEMQRKLHEAYTQKQIQEAHDKAAAEEEQLVKSIEDFAFTRIRPATAPPPSGDTLAGWPLAELVGMLPPEKQFPALKAIRMKHGPMINPAHLHGLSTGQAAPVGPSDGEMLCMRMRWPSLNTTKFDCVHIHRGKDKIFVFVVNNDGQPCTLEDDLNLFPSDQLVTSLKVMGG